MPTAVKDNLVEGLLTSNPQLFDTILKNKDEFRVQVIYTKIDRKENGEPVFTDHFFQTENPPYFYPASTVKLPVALLALQRLHELNIKGLDMNSTMITETNGDGQTSVEHDSTAANLLPSVANYIKKILIVSDNDAFNRLYEFLGQEYINDRLHKMGYPDVQIIHRLAIYLTEQQNRHTNPIRFLDAEGKTLYAQPAMVSKMKYELRDVKLGKGYLNDTDQLVNEPYDFARKNRMSSYELHTMVRGIFFPESIPASKRFNLTPGDYEFVRKYMSMYPGESDHPAYDTVEYPFNFVKKFIYGDGPSIPNTDIRIFNKTGTAYGFLTDASYVVDFKNKTEFFLTAIIYCNSDGIINDNKYDYESVGYPFLKNLGRVIYDYDLQRKRKGTPELNALRYSY